MSEREKQVACPICNKDYLSSEIDFHANKCLFLNSEESSSVVNKRSFNNDPSPSKRFRNDVSTDDTSGDSSIPIHGNGSQLVNLSLSGIPLAEQMRPSELSNFIGQEHVLGNNKILRSLLEKKEIPSMILWGPPGCGKTTLAHIIARLCKQTLSTRFVKLSAIMAGINDVKELVKVAKQEQTSFKRRTILFMDEIHRFNKLQQDVFLPHVESGTITLIGATTENPSFSLNSALLSRCRVIVLEKHKTEHLYQILEHAIESTGGKIVHNNCEISQRRFVIEADTVQWLAEMCDGDARIALNSLQLAIQTWEASSDSRGCSITLEDIKDGVKRSHILYDKKGDEHYNIISAMHKSIRASDDNAALYWITRMIKGGEDPIFIARRLVRAASEDIGLADPMALTIAVSAMQGCQLLGMPECDVLLAQCAVYLARAPKSVEVYHALGRAKEAVEEHKGAHPSVPLHLRNAPTRLMKNIGYSKGYNTAHKDHSNLMYMPEGMEHVNFFEKC